MRRYGFKYRKLAAITGKLNPEKQKQFLEEESNPAIKKAQKGEIELLFCDAAHFTMSAVLYMVLVSSRDIFKNLARPQPDHVLRAVNTITKEVTTFVNTAYITAETVMDFLRLLKEKYSDKPVFLVLDNAKYQHCRAVMKKAGELGIILLFLPPYSPNLNIMERLWKFTKNKSYMPNIMILLINFMMPLKAFLIPLMINAMTI
jgi:hypothetical protein